MKSKYTMGLFMALIFTFVPVTSAFGAPTTAIAAATTPHEGGPFVVISLGVLSFIVLVYFIVSMFKDNN